MSVLFIDADCELPYEKCKELNLDSEFIISMPYTICDKETFYDLGNSYNAKEFFTLVRNNNMPITSGLNAEIYKEHFEKYFAKTVWKVSALDCQALILTMRLPSIVASKQLELSKSVRFSSDIAFS